MHGERKAGWLRRARRCPSPSPGQGSARGQPKGCGCRPRERVGGAEPGQVHAQGCHPFSYGAQGTHVESPAAAGQSDGGRQVSLREQLRLVQAALHQLAGRRVPRRLWQHQPARSPVPTGPVELCIHGCRQHQSLINWRNLGATSAGWISQAHSIGAARLCTRTERCSRASSRSPSHRRRPPL